MTAPTEPEPKPRRLALIVEDSLTERTLLTQLARRNGLDVAQAADAEAAVRAIERRAPDVLLLDIFLPGTDGLTLLARLREEHPFIPVVVVSASDDQQHVEEALNLGAVNFLRKPIRAEEFRFVLDRIARALAEEEGVQDALVAVEERRTRLSLPCDTDLLSRVVAYLGYELRNHYPGRPIALPDLKLALYEALANAVEHGNLEIGYDTKTEALEEADGLTRLVHERRSASEYADRKIHVDVLYLPNTVEYRIRDEGPGFDPASFDLSKALADTESLHGRGLALICHYMDEVSWNDTGNEIRMKRQLEPRRRV